MYVCMYVCMCLCTYVRTYVHTHIHTYKYIHTYAVFSPHWSAPVWNINYSDELTTTQIIQTEIELSMNWMNSNV